MAEPDPPHDDHVVAAYLAGQALAEGSAAAADAVAGLPEDLKVAGLAGILRASREATQGDADDVDPDG